MCRLFNVTGRVQGVFFRVSTRDAARPLGLNGSAVNLADGSVDVRACGDDDAIEELRTWLRDGPPHARVDRVEERPADCSNPTSFTTG